MSGESAVDVHACGLRTGASDRAYALEAYAPKSHIIVICGRHAYAYKGVAQVRIDFAFVGKPQRCFYQTD